MNRDVAIGFVLIGLLFGGIFLFARRPAPVANQFPRLNNITVTPISAEPPRYRNKETRVITWNDDGLPTKIEITRDFTVS